MFVNPYSIDSHTSLLSNLQQGVDDALEVQVAPPHRPLLQPPMEGDPPPPLWASSGDQPAELPKAAQALELELERGHQQLRSAQAGEGRLAVTGRSARLMARHALQQLASAWQRH